jgi:ADP-dependent NAD(P)H-hydrate dehydratase / NAD(P)H-hydrate epimerase
MTELLTAAQMRAIELAAIESGAVTGLDLMERAGRGVIDAVFAEWPELAAGTFKAIVLCGPGNNGGDGFVVARLLKEWGWEVAAFLYGDAERLPPDARVNYERWAGMGEAREIASARLIDHDLVIDALFGIGLTRCFALSGDLSEDFQRIMADGVWRSDQIRRTYIAAIDVVSGLDADSGRQIEAINAPSCANVGAHLTVTFHRPKVGHFLGTAPVRSGKLVVADIGLIQPPDACTDPRPAISPSIIRLCERPKFPWLSPRLSKADPYPENESHKFSHGHALILSGGPGKGGAARMAARGALRIGAGLVTLSVPPAALQENAGRLDVVMLGLVADAVGLAAVLRDERINALCLGPGFGTGVREAGLVAVALGEGGVNPRPVVLDADALTLLAREPPLFGRLHDRCVLTPHGGEFARLFPDIAARLAEPATKGPTYSKVDATREAAKRAGCVVLYKGPDTVIAGPDGRCSINSAHYDRAAPWLATAGSGDVLAGFITGLLARGFAPMQAAETAAWLHVECARSFGPGLIAEDLPDELPKVFRAIGL